jgi:hypothetical protein
MNEGRKMKKNVVGISILLTLLILTSLSCVVSAKGINYYYEISEKIFDNIESEENETNLGTFGPVSPLFNISKITLLNGSASEIEKIERILKNRILQLILPLTIIKCNDLDFSVSYLKNVPFFLPIIRHLSYGTTIYKDFHFPFNKDSILGKSHTIVVDGFNGYFTFARLRIIKGSPALFAFSGNYDNVTIIR